MEWISVKDKLPTNGVWVLFYTWKGLLKGSFWGDCWRTEEGQYYNTNQVSHWMPLPEPPKE